MRLLYGIVFCLLCVGLYAAELDLWNDGVADSNNTTGANQVYSDGVLVVLGDGADPSDPNELPQADSILWRFAQFEEGAANGSDTNLIDYGPTGTNYGLMLNSMEFEDLSTTFAPR